MSAIISDTLIILSDLHLGPGWRHGELGSLFGQHWLLRLFSLDKKLSQYLEQGLAAHDPSVTGDLPLYLSTLLWKLKQEGYEKEDFDFHVVLGDVVTWPDERSFDFARRYLSWNWVEDIAGLGLHREKLLMIPGNHDKLFKSNLFLYHEFARHVRVEPQPQPGRSYLVSKPSGNREFLFASIDASVYCGKNLQISKVEDLDRLTNFELLSCRDHIARGKVTEELINELVEKIVRLKRGESVDGAHLKDYPTATKILMIHYALDFKKVVSTSLWKSLSNFAVPHECNGIEVLLERVKGEFDLAVHGHLHSPKVYYCGSLPVIAVGTSAQRTTESPRSFYLIKLTESGKIFAEH
ncbi:MAG TPA: metallophosphoesterase, partial [Nitrososphaera sp.]|nr:metallophosphoesterase [Nitrososphaera sp.]